MSETSHSKLTKRETYFVHNSLISLIKALEKRYTTIDLRNETCVVGKITEVDGYMNLLLNDAAIYDTDGTYRYFSMLHIQARNIRNIHIPDNVSITKAIRNQLSRESPSSVQKKQTFKESRAKKKQKETLNLIKEMKEKKMKSETQN